MALRLPEGACSLEMSPVPGDPFWDLVVYWIPAKGDDEGSKLYTRSTLVQIRVMPVDPDTGDDDFSRKPFTITPNDLKVKEALLNKGLWFEDIPLFINKETVKWMLRCIDLYTGLTPPSSRPHEELT